MTPFQLHHLKHTSHFWVANLLRKGVKVNAVMPYIFPLITIIGNKKY